MASSSIAAPPRRLAEIITENGNLCHASWARRVDPEQAPPLKSLNHWALMLRAAGQHSMHIIDSHFHWWPRSIFEKLCKRQDFPKARVNKRGGYDYMRRTDQRPASQLLGRVVRSRQAVRIHGQPRPPGRRGLLDRAVLGVVLRHAGRGRPRLRPDVERGDGRRAEEISRPALGQRRGAAAGHQGRHRGGRRRGEPARPDGRQPARQRRRGRAHRRRAAAAVLRALRQARPAAVPASDRRDLPGHAVGRLRRRAAPEPRPRHRGQRRGDAARSSPAPWSAIPTSRS